MMRKRKSAKSGQIGLLLLTGLIFSSASTIVRASEKNFLDQGISIARSSDDPADRLKKWVALINEEKSFPNTSDLEQIATALSSRHDLLAFEQKILDLTELSSSKPAATQPTRSAPIVNSPDVRVDRLLTETIDRLNSSPYPPTTTSKP